MEAPSLTVHCRCAGGEPGNEARLHRYTDFPMQAPIYLTSAQ